MEITMMFVHALIGYSVCVEKNACKQVKCLFSDLFEICAL